MLPALCRACCRVDDDGPDPATGRCRHCGSARVLTHGEIRRLGIAHVDCDAFYASVEKRDRPELRTRPLIVGHAGGRGVVTTACYIARRFGVHSAMPMFKARDLCPHAVVVAPDMAKYKRVSLQIREIFQATTPVIEPVSLDEAYLDLTDEYRLSSPHAAAALTLIAKRIEREVRITVSIGLSCNKFLAKLASELRKPRGFSVIGAAEARSFLTTLPVSKINGVGAVTARHLEASGIHTIGDLQAMNESNLVARFGKFGRRLARFAQAEDDRAVTPDREAKSISAETTFRDDIAAVSDLLTAAAPLCRRVAAALERKGVAGGTVVVKLKTADFRILTRNKKLTHPTMSASVLLQTAAPLIEREADGRRFRLIGIGVDHLAPAAQADPPDLFKTL